MATTAEINAHDRLISTVGRDFGQGLRPLFTDLFDSIIAMPQPTRIEIQQRFLPIRQYAQSNLTRIDGVLDSNTQMNSDVIQSTTVIDDQRLRSEVLASVNSQIDQEQAEITNSVMAAALTGASIALVIRELRRRITRMITRISIRFEMSTRQYDGAVTILRGRANTTPVRYRYVGGLIPESRDFCRSMDGRVLTEEEIRRTWSNQSWQGKAPGDPFVVRGGYNCRHMFVPVAANE